MSYAIRVHEVGGPEVMKWEQVEVPSPGPGQAKIRHHVVGLNFIDVYHRNGLYKQPSLPFVLGTEGAGEVLEIGEGVTDIAVGDRVAYASVIGAYAEERLIAADRLVKLPASVDDKTAAAIMLQGLTVQYLLKSTYPVGPGTVLLLHAAAGGIGLLATQWATHLGATVIGTVGSEEKAALAKAAGAHHVINYNTENFPARVKEITGGKGVDVVYDSVGKDTFPGSLDCLKPRGLWVSFGNSSGPVPPFETSLLAAKGSLYATRPVLNGYTAARSELLERAADLFDALEKGIVKVSVNQTYSLSNAAQAHRDLEARRTTGSTVFVLDRIIRPSAMRDSD
ncbi:MULTISPECIES: quinone oxidoreductase [Rhodomicrobium]|uniref:quinone oxidoreductase family protein n=1 Tax=Rhodomicrobium TaxID=1068 RepID=UPI000B4AB088|nr:MULTISPECIES: quinone oxidoreductase [Rhodomicrobium]